MILSLSEEQRDLQEMVRRFVEEVSPSAEVRRLMDSPSGYDDRVWKQMADEIGLQSVAIAEELGGQGLGLSEVALVCSEFGRGLVCTPYFSTVCLAGSAIEHTSPGPARDELLRAIAAGEILTLGLAEASGRWDPAHVSLRAEAQPGSDRYRLRGSKHFVLDGHTAARILVVARAADGIGLFVADGYAPGLERRAQKSFDPTRKLARLDFADVEVARLDAPGEADTALDRALDQSCALLCAEMLGGMECVLDTAVDYAKSRTQFGRAIGSFQAIKHKCADLLIQLEAARSTVDQAIESCALDAPSRALDVSVAKAWCSEAYPHAARENIQIHGGVGFTWEYDAHLHLRRAASSAALLGDAAWHQERIAQRVQVEARGEAS